MAYTHTTLATAKSLLAARLSDPNKVWWVDAELEFALVEALRLWNVITLHDRAKGYFTTSASTAFYDLATTLLSVDDGELLRAQTLRDRDLVSEIEYHLIEAQGLSTWAGTDQFTLSQIVTAIQRRRDRFLADTACVVSRRTGDTPDENGVVELPDTVVGIRRAVFKTNGGRYWSLRPSDERMVMAQSQYWFTPRTPTAYSISAEGNLRVQVLPPPEDLGTLETIVVTTGAALDTTANSETGTLLGIPDDYAWGIKYGALADLLRDAQSVDPMRAEFCEQMYSLAVQLASRMPVVLTARINGVPVQVAGLANTDMRINGWEGTNTGTPSVLSSAGPEFLALTKVPNGTHHITLDVVRAALVPTENTDYLEIGREHLDAILSMAQRICMFKCGGQEFASTESLASKFFAEGQKYSFRRSAVSTALQVITKTSSRAVTTQPWERIPRVVEDKADEVRSERNARRRPFRKR